MVLDTSRCIGGLVVLSTLILLVESQNFPLVGVNDSIASIGNGTTKIYTTTVRLRAVRTDVNFVPEAFARAVRPFYGGMQGFITVSSVVSSLTTTTSDVDVTYDAEYSYAILRQFYGTDDNRPVDLIGNFQSVQNGLISPIDTFATLWIVEPESASIFSFSGKSVCSQPGAVTCPDNTDCIESLTGVKIECVSPCKTEYCRHNATCAQADHTVAPTCSCPSMSDVWYLGARCETLVELWMIILAAVGTFILLVAAIVIGCCCYAAKRRQKEKEAQFLEPKDLKSFDNHAYVKNEKLTPRGENGYQHNGLGADGAVAIAASRRSRSTSRDRRRRRSRSSSYRRDRRSRPHGRRRRSSSRSRRRDDRRHSRRRRTDETSGYADDSSFDGSESSEEEDVTQKEDTLDGTSSSSEASSSETSASSGDENGGRVAIDVRDQGTSPIRWVAPSQSSKSSVKRPINIAERKGWKPSLGPQMFNIARNESESDESGNDIAWDETLPAGSKPSPYIPDTDL